MKKLLLIPVLAALLLTGCTINVPSHSAGEDPKPAAPSEIAKAPTEEIAPYMTDSELDTVYLSVIRGQYPILVGVEDSTLIEFATSFCSAADAAGFNAAADFSATNAVDNGLDPGMAGAMIGAGVMTYCPEYSADMTAYVEANR